MDYLTELKREAKDLLAHSKVWRAAREELGVDVHDTYLEALIASFRDMENTWKSVISHQLETIQKVQKKLNDEQEVVRKKEVKLRNDQVKLRNDQEALRSDQEALYTDQEALRNDQEKCRSDRGNISKHEGTLARREQAALIKEAELEVAQRSSKSLEEILQGFSLSSIKEEEELQQSRQEVKRLGEDLQSSKERVDRLLGNVATYKEMHSEGVAKADGLQRELGIAKAELEAARMKIRQFEDEAEEQNGGDRRGSGILSRTGSSGDLEGATQVQSRSQIPPMTPARTVSFKRPSKVTPGTPSRPPKKTKPMGSGGETREWSKAWNDFVGVVNSLRPSCDEYVEGADVRALLGEMVRGILAGPDHLASLVDSDLRDEWYCYAEVYEMGPLAWNAIVVEDAGCARHRGKPCWQIQITVGADMVKKNRWRFSSGSRE